MDFEHLHPDARAVLQSSLEDRLEFVRRDRFIEYPAAEAILRDLADVVTYPRVQRPPCRAVIADSDNGKTSLTSELIKRNPVVLDATGNPITKVLWAECPPAPDEGRLFSSILTALDVLHRPDAAPERLEAIVSQELIAHQTTTLVIDELHAMLNGTARNQRLFMAALKRLSNTRNISVVCCGTQEVTRALATDPQFMTRFQKLALPRWQANEDFQRLLVSFEMFVPLPKPSGLSQGRLVQLIYMKSARTIGSVRAIVRAAAEMALREGEDRITYALLDKAVAGLVERLLNGGRTDGAI